MNKFENIYVCGPTVYDYVHIGNMRSVMFFDIWNRIKKYAGYKINYLHNITDIDDKIIQKAKQEMKEEKEISSFYTDEYLKLFDLFNIELPNKIIKVTDVLKDIENYIKELIETENAYMIEGNVFFDVTKHSIYGKISNRNLNDTLNSEDEYNKKNIHDFALWKKTNEGIKFDSIFGLGRPGWHTECVVMINKYFKNQTLDYHGGGIDLIFPHHENENIQHYSLNKTNLTKKWIHSGFLNFEGKKMSKSLGNVIYAKDFANKYNTNTLRLLILTTNINSPINLTELMIADLEKKILFFRKKYYLYFLEKNNFETNYENVKKILDLYLNLHFSKANLELNLLLKNNEIGTFVKIIDILGFDFNKSLPSKKDIEIYEEWKSLVKKKNFESSDKLREILQNKKYI
ncbi:class I tRNA ligase family protein [[Mycoplasma] collis]|uniref:class I tRNA ligase family protein n=1 Tax=[Mycoplasma] collis TaxID=2127 RepID=UPI00051BAC44|nr:class I tRNA ligase family protein [[Mycoplasma] collis]